MRHLFWLVLASLLFGLSACSSETTPTPTGTARLTVAIAEGEGGGTVSSSPAGINCDQAGEGCSYSFPKGSKVTLTQTPAAGSRFLGWSGACEGVTTCTLTLDSNKQLSAAYEKTAFVLRVTKPGSGAGMVTSFPAGIDCGEDCQALFSKLAPSIKVNFGLEPAEGSLFNGYGGDCSEASCLVTMDSDRTVQVIFSKPKNDTYGLQEGTTLTIAAPGVLGNDVDLPNGTVKVIESALIPPAHGTLILNADGSFSYEHDGSNVLSDSFTYRVKDILGNTEEAVVTLMDIGAANEPPTATNVTALTPENTPVIVTLMGTDPEGEALSYEVVVPPAKGTLTGVAPELLYTPNPDTTGTDTFTYRVNDGATDSAPATVTITISAVNDPPVANVINKTTLEDTAIAITLAGTDPEGQPLTYTIVTNPTKGVLSGTAPALTYTPAVNETGDDSFTYTVSDGVSSSAPALVRIAITPVNDPPVAEDDAYEMEQDGTLEENVLLNDTDPDITPPILTAILQTAPVDGVFALADNGTFTYTPPALFVGDVSFTYVANDGEVDSAEAATVIITVAAPLAPPVVSSPVVPSEVPPVTAP